MKYKRYQVIYKGDMQYIPIVKKLVDMFRDDTEGFVCLPEDIMTYTVTTQEHDIIFKVREATTGLTITQDIKRKRKQ